MQATKNNWLLFVFVTGLIGFFFLLDNFDNSVAFKKTTVVIQEREMDIPIPITILVPKAIKNIPDLKKFPPIRLIIPSIDVDAPVDHVGLTVKGAMGAPVEPDHTGWLKTYPIPGNKGSAVIDGHRGWLGHTPAAFDRLHELNVGDLVYVQDRSGSTTRFKVVNKKTYSFTQETMEVFAATGRRLNLITCEGDWNANEHNYSQRLVVFTEMD